jgi:hypothetical protein
MQEVIDKVCMGGKTAFNSLHVRNKNSEEPLQGTTNHNNKMGRNILEKIKASKLQLHSLFKVNEVYS